MTYQLSQSQGNMQLLQQIVEYSPSIIIITEGAQTDYRIIYVNAAFERETGYTKQEVIGRNPRFLQGEDTAQAAIADIRAALADERDCTTVLRNYRKDGSLFWNELRLAPIRRDDGALTHYVGIQNNVTEREEASERLRRTSANLRAMLKGSNQSFVLMDREMRIVEFDAQTAINIEDVFAEPMRRGADMRAYVADENLDRFTQAFQRALDGKTTEGEITIVGQTKTYYFETQMYPIRDEQDNIIGVCSSAIDITQRKLAEIALQESEALYRVLTEHSHDMIALHKPDGTFLYVSPSFERKLGFTIDELAAITPGDTVHPDDVARTTRAHQRALEEQLTVELDYRLKKKDGTYIWVSSFAKPILNEQGEVEQLLAVSRDITERKQMEKALRDSEELYRNLFEHTMQEVHLWKLVRDEQGAIKTWQLVEANPAALKAWGKNRLDIVGKTTDEIFSYNATEQFMPIVERIFSEDTPYTWEAYFPPTGASLYMTSVPFGEYFISTGTDITERKQMEDKLRESEERYRLMAENVSDMISTHSLQGIYTYVSPSCERLLGYKPEELLGRSAYDLFHPDDLQHVATSHETIIEDQPSDFIVEYRIRHKMGDYIWMETISKIVTDEATGEPQMIIAVSRDTTMRKQMETALRESEARFRQLAENIEAVFWLIDVESDSFLYVSPAFDTIWQRSRFDIMEQGPEALNATFHPDDYDWVMKQAADARVNPTESLMKVTHRIVRPSGDVRSIHTQFFTVQNGSNDVYRVAAITHDITEELRLQQQEKALQLEQARSRLLANFITKIGHEFRTPLSIISTSAYFLEQLDDADKRKVRSQRITKQVERITALLEGIQQMVKLDTAQTIQRELVDVSALIRRLITTCASEIRDKNLTIDFTSQDAVEIFTGDDQLLTRMIYQLLMNAIQHSDEGGTIEIVAEDTGDSVHITIRDEGQGIARQHLAHIFDRFYRVDMAHSTEGLGLGLPIAMKIAALHEGTIAVESELGQGSEFIVKLPKTDGESYP